MDIFFDECIAVSVSIATWGTLGWIHRWDAGGSTYLAKWTWLWKY